MYKVPMKMPKYCNKCPFGRCNYSRPAWAERKYISQIDGKENLSNQWGYVCNLDYNENGKYTKIYRAGFGENIPRPEDCKLEEIE